jgi:hypothetical protein
MEQVLRQAAQAELVEPSMPGVSWAAVLAGAVASLALTLVLLSFGAGMGFAVVSPWGNSGVSGSERSALHIEDEQHRPHQLGQKSPGPWVGRWK